MFYFSKMFIFSKNVRFSQICSCFQILFRSFRKLFVFSIFFAGCSQLSIRPARKGNRGRGGRSSRRGGTPWRRGAPSRGRSWQRAPTPVHTRRTPGDGRAAARMSSAVAGDGRGGGSDEQRGSRWRTERWPGASHEGSDGSWTPANGLSRIQVILGSSPKSLFSRV